MARSKLAISCSAALLLAAASAFAAGAPADSKISENVRTALFRAAQTSSDNGINVETRDGVVYLSGHVDTDAQRKNAETMARHVPGVKRVVASLTLRSDGQ